MSGEDRIRSSFALVPDWVDERVTDGTAMRLYVRLARKYADRQRHAFPGEDVLAEELGCTDRTIRRAVGILEATGAMVITRERKADGHFGRNLYYLPTEDPCEGNGRKQTSSGERKPSSPDGRKQTSAGRRKQTSGQNQTHSSNQTSDADASGTNADASCRADEHAEAASASEDQRAGGAKDQDRQEEGGEATDEPTLFSWPGLDQHPNGNGSNHRSTPAAKSRRRSKQTDLTPDQAAAFTGAMSSWAETWPATHAGARPTTAKRGQAAREIKQLLLAGNDPARVIAAAESAARNGFATVETELAKLANGNGRRNSNDRAYVPYRDNADESAYERPFS